MKRFSSLLVVMVMLLLIPNAVSAASSAKLPAISINIDQKTITSDVPPVIINNRTLVPLRVISENMGAQVFWDNKARKVTVVKPDFTLELFIDKTAYQANGQAVTADVSPQIINDRTFVPIRLISEQLGAKVGWNNDTRTVLIESPKPPEPPKQPEPLPSTDPEPAIPAPTIPTGDVQAISTMGDQITVQTNIEQPQIQVFTMDNPNRVVVDIVYSKPAELGEIVPINSTLINQVRYSYFNNAPDTTRIVLDVKQKVDVQTQMNGNQIVLTLTPHIYKIVIDAGHGGKDPGAKGITGVYEKDFTLDLVLRLTNLFANDARFKIILTRGDDSYPTLDDRVQLANKENADLFISVHANKFYKPETRGTETYYTRDNSKDFATMLHAALISVTQFPDRGVKTANFYVIKNTTMPAALLEIGFLSNQEDNARMTDPTFRDQVAAALQQAILGYLQLP